MACRSNWLGVHPHCCFSWLDVCVRKNSGGLRGSLQFFFMPCPIQVDRFQSPLPSLIILRTKQSSRFLRSYGQMKRRLLLGRLKEVEDILNLHRLPARRQSPVLGSYTMEQLFYRTIHCLLRVGYRRRGSASQNLQIGINLTKWRWRNSVGRQGSQRTIVALPTRAAD